MLCFAPGIKKVFIMKILITTLVAASTLFSAIAMPTAATAQSTEIIIQRDRDFDRDGRDRYEDHRERRHWNHEHGRLDRDRRNRHHDRDLAIGIIGGLAAGAIIGGMIDDDAPGYDRYPRPLPPRYPPPRPWPVPEYRGDRDVVFQPWSRQWRDFCSNRYRTFNPNTGTYLGNDGRWHFCTVR